MHISVVQRRTRIHCRHTTGLVVLVPGSTVLAPDRLHGPSLRVLVELVRCLLCGTHATDKVALHLLHAFDSVVGVGVQGAHDAALRHRPAQTHVSVWLSAGE